MTGGGTDADTQSLVIALGEAQIPIILHWKIPVAKGHFDGIRKALVPDGFLCCVPDVRNLGQNAVSGILHSGAFGETLLQLPDNGITHLQLECLILGCIAVCDDMKADDPGGNTLLDRFCRFLTV